jgi:serine/threonine-protein kinase
MVGQTVGKYRVEERVGRGGMGTVYRAVDETLHREVAIKVLNSELNDPEVARRFRAEAITVARLSHPGIATVYELFERDGQWLMVMEFVRGETLERLIERAGPLSAERASDLAMQALSALAHAHGLGVVHRDLKPANLMLTDGGSVKIMDFGIARVSGSEHLTNAGFMMGTPAYMAPEQVLGHEVDARADLYAMGVVLYRLVTGKLPFKGETPFALAQSQVNDPPTPIRTARQGLPEWLEQVIALSLAKSPGDRFQSAQEFRSTLERCLAGLPMVMPPDASAPTGMMLTPPGLPTGSLAARMPSGALPTSTPTSGDRLPTGAVSTSPTGLPTTAGLSGVSGATGSTAMSDMPTQLHSTAGLAASGTGAQQLQPGAPTGSMPVSTGAVPVPPATTGATASTAVKPKPALNNTAMIAAAVVVVLALAGGGWWLMHRHGAATPAPDATTSAPTTAASATPPDTPPATTAAPPDTPPPPSSSATQTPPATAPVTTTPAAKPAGDNGASAAAAGRGTTAAAGAAAPGAAGTPPAGRGTDATSPPAAGARGANGPATAPPLDDSFVTYKDIKFMAVTGQDSQEQDALMNLGGGHIAVVPKNGGAAFATVPYGTVVHATYVHTKDPKWDPSLPSPPDQLQIHGFMRGARHWLALQSKTAYVLLRLDDNNWRSVLDAVETRCRIKVDRPAEGGN